MTKKSAFSEDEWTTLLHAATGAGMYLVMAARGGTFRETVAMSKAYAEARTQHGESELLDEIVAARPKTDHTRYHSPEEMRDAVLGRLRTAVELLESKATPEEVDGYRRFVLALAQRVAAAHQEDGQEDGQAVSPAEADALQQIAGALGTAAPQP